MRGLRALPALLALSCAHAPEPEPEPLLESRTDPGEDVERLLQLEQERARALAEGDAFVLRELLDDGFIAVDATGVRRNASQLVERVRMEGRAAERRVHIRVEDFAAR